MLQNNAPHYIILATTPEYTKQTGYTKEAFIGKGIFEAFSDNPDDPIETGEAALKTSLEHVRLQKEPHQLPVQRYDVVGQNGHCTKKYWKAIDKPVFNNAGEITYIIHSAEDITHAGLIDETKVAERKVEESEQNFRNTIPQAPVAMAIFRGSYFIVEIASNSMYELLRRWKSGTAGPSHLCRHARS